MPKILAFLLLLAASPLANACVTSGVCGSSYCAAPPAVSCSPSSCQPGYSCGQYGCARNRARSALTQKVDGIFIDSTNSRELLGSQESSRETPPKFKNPNFIFRQCCEQRGLPDACLNKCHFNSYTKDALQGMYFKTDGCPLEAAADMHFCAAQGRDHTQCCVRNGVTTTLAGQKCLTFCDQRPDRVTKLDYSYVPCYDRFENMKQCFYNEIKAKAEQQFGARRR
ncbi:Protein CBG15775 [Caenorhabditis briggsae]|uniref:Protein CBG15775 n=1 Tax=Caenorhabditis briggsae TaxID=6238 RepID=A8XMS1_CAEBR|nr:Protein CBG15775 [Caenorhabditis briggsae]CAP33947.2 Protein CBG15775 [Caenorhabditis briggsae]